MSTNADRTEPVNTRPDAHWYAHSEGGPLPQHEQLIIPAHAVCEALAALGHDAAAAEVRRFLESKGIHHVNEAVINEVKAQLPPGSCQH
jgi:hypothetical protein